MRFRYLLSACAVLLLWSSVVFGAVKFVTYANKEKGFSISVPDVWTKLENINERTVFAVVSPQENKADDFKENLNIVIDAAVGIKGLKQYHQKNVDGLKKDVKDFKVISQGAKTINKVQAQWIIFTGSYDGRVLKQKLYSFYTMKKCITITCTAAPKAYQSYEKTFDKIVASFKF